MELHTLTIHALHDLLRRREVSATEVVTAFLARIAKLDPKLNCYLTSLADTARMKRGVLTRELPLTIFRLWPRSLLPSRMSSASTVCGQPAVRASWKGLCRPMTAPSWRG